MDSRTLFTAHQPAYLPWLGYLHKLAVADEMVVLDNVQYEKNSFINRNKIKGSNGLIWLTIPILNSGHIDKTIKEMKLDNKGWKDNHWKNIYYNYKKAPYFNKYADYFEDFYKKDWEYLIEVTNEQLSFFTKLLGIKTNIIYQSDIGVNSKKQNLILDLCNDRNRDNFIFGSNGKDYADLNYFKKHDIQVYFQEYKHPQSYPQLYGSFEPNMAIIDLLFNVPKEQILDIIMSNNIKKSSIQNIFKESK